MTHPIPTILIIDDLRLVRMQFKLLLTATGYQILDVETPDEAVSILATRGVDLIILDLNMPGVEGVSFLTQLRHEYPHIPVIMATVSTNPRDVRDSLKLGAIDYVFKDELLDRPELLQLSVSAALAIPSVHQAVKGNSTPESSFFIPNHPSYRTVYQMATQAVQCGMSTLILGETGVGKGMLVAHIHRQLLPGQPLVTVNCGAIMASLAEAELFGADEGAYTDSKVSRKGKLEQADGGILFLDEIGNLTMPLQEKLLCAIESQRVTPLGGITERQLSFRVIAATNADLSAAIAAKTFRSDLYYRIKQFSVTLPPIRDNPSCVGMFAAQYLAEFNALFGAQVKLTHDMLTAYTAYDWPGNLRELKNEIRMMVWAMGQGVSYTPPVCVSSPSTSSTRLYDQLETAECQQLNQLLIQHRYNISAIARTLGIPRSTLQGRLKKYNLYPNS